uniref:Uncharacterized protein n=1 Tax=Timema poppense TaxID=170557 RepID=A0A7R9H9M5_TIMPO|nr:unnamed protein product [Timema poppensis]
MMTLTLVKSLPRLQLVCTIGEGPPPNTPSPPTKISCLGSETEQFTVMWVLFALIVLGNSSVLVALLINKSRKSRMNFFIMQLALAAPHSPAPPSSCNTNATHGVLQLTLGTIDLILIDDDDDDDDDDDGEI